LITKNIIDFISFCNRKNKDNVMNRPVAEGLYTRERGQCKCSRGRKTSVLFLIEFFYFFSEVTPQGIRPLTKYDICFTGRITTIHVAVTDPLPHTQTFWFSEKRTFLFLSHSKPPSFFICAKRYLFKESVFPHKSISPSQIVCSQSRSQYPALWPL